MVSSGLHASARGPIRAADRQGVPLRLRCDSDGTQIGCDQLEAVALLDAQLAHFVKHCLPARPARQHGEHGHLVDQRRDLIGRHDGSPQLGRPDEQIRRRLGALPAQIHPLDVRAHALEDRQKPGAGWIRADTLDHQLPVFRQHRRRHEERSRRDIPRYGQLKAAQADG